MKEAIGILLCATTLALGAAPMAIVEFGRSAYSLYLPSDATAAERTAASELTGYIEKSTGVKLPIVSTRTTEKQILIGVNPEVRALLPEVDFAVLRPDEIMIAPVGDQLVLCGEGERGTLYAVYEFLKRELGIRFWSADEELIPHCEILSLPNSLYRYAPPGKVRLIYTSQLLKNPAFAAKMHCYGPNYTQSAEYGMSNEVLIGPWHTFDRFLPADQYLQSNPEYFSLVDGKRVGGQFKGQLCLSNPALRQKFLEAVQLQLRANPGVKVISVSQNDNNHYCCCENCRKIDETGGSPAASVITFVNYIADHIREEFPEVEVQTFAYQYSRKPPVGIQLAPNVSILLCAIEADVSKPLDDPNCAANVQFLQDLAAWKTVGAKLAFWYYIVNFNDLLLPHPNLEAVQSDVRLLAGFNPSLLMIESDSANPVPVDDLLIMKHWLAAQLLWDPSLDPEALQKEFVKKYYGPSAPLIERYLALRTAAAAHSTVYTSTFEYTAAWLDSDSLFTGLALLNSAEESVDDPVIIRRIELLKKPLEYMLIANFDQLRGLSGCPEYAKVRKSAECYLAFLDRCQVGFEGSTRTIDNTRGKLERFIAFPPVRSQEPVFLRQFQGRRMIIAEENAFVIWNGTAYGEIIPDPLAANGWTIKLKNAATWSVQLPIRRDFNLNKEYDIYAACRLDPASLPAGGRYFLGGYDSARLESYIGFYADASTLTDMEYRYLSLGTHRLREKGYLFFDSNLRAETPCSYLNHLVFVEK